MTRDVYESPAFVRLFQAYTGSARQHRGPVDARRRSAPTPTRR